MPKISIIVPFRNAQIYLERCIENLEKQLFKDYEIILIDDGSTDKSEQITNKMMNNQKIKYYYLNKDTRGVGKARNYGIEKASGKYLMFVDVDDMIDENLLYNMNKFMKDGIELIKYKMKIINDESDIKKNKINEKELESYEILNGEQCFNELYFKDKYIDSPCVYLIKKELFHRNNLKFIEDVFHEDFGTIPYLIISAKTIVVTDYYGYYYIQSTNSIMRDIAYTKTIDKVNDKLKIYDNMKKRIDNLNIKEITKQNIKNYFANSVILALKDLDKKDRKKYEKIIKEKEIIKDIKEENIKQKIKKKILEIDISLFLDYKNLIKK